MVFNRVNCLLANILPASLIHLHVHEPFQPAPQHLLFLFSENKNIYTISNNIEILLTQI